MPSLLPPLPPGSGPLLLRSRWRLLLLVPALCLFFSAVSLGQEQQWDKTWGGSGFEYLAQLQQTQDGGYVVGGSSRSGASGDKSGPSRGGLDYWVLKVDASGNKIWDKTFGGSGEDELFALLQTHDGGYILGGSSRSSRSSDKTGDCRGQEAAAGACPADYWVIKLDAAGTLEWDKTLGGSGEDILTALQQTRDGGYILGGYSSSAAGGDKTQQRHSPEFDYWVLKLDAAGNIAWDKTFGGNRNDHLSALQQTRDGGYILGGDSYSGASGDRSQVSRGAYDYWVVKLDANGNKQWDRAFGGSQVDQAPALQQTRDGGYILGGSSHSGISGEKSEANREDCPPNPDGEYYCSYDYWVVKLDSAGNKQWDKTLGGSGYDQLSALQQTHDGGYVLGGFSNSGIGGEKTAPSRQQSDDFWVVKLDVAGTLVWDKTLGGSGMDYLYALQQTRGGGYILGGSSLSAIPGDTDPNSRDQDFRVVKISEAPLPPQVLSFSPAKGLPGTLVTLRGANLSGTTAVRFRGRQAAFEVVSDEVVRATVPADAVSGEISIETPAGSGHSPAPFTVLQPEIAAFLPFQGRVGATVYLVGTRLSTTREVYFQGLKSPRVHVYFDWLITAEVPQGATTGKLRVVLAGGGTDTTKSDFTVISLPITPPPAPPPARQVMPAAAASGLETAAQVGAFPNPFQGQVTFSFTLAWPQLVVVKVYDIRGREVTVLYQGEVPAHQVRQVVWRPAPHLPNGLYLIGLQSARQLSRQKVVLAR